MRCGTLALNEKLEIIAMFLREKKRSMKWEKFYKSGGYFL